MTGPVCTLSPDWAAYTAVGALALGLLGLRLWFWWTGKKLPKGEPEIKITKREEGAGWTP